MLLAVVLSVIPLAGPTKTPFDDQCAAIKKERQGIDRAPRCERVRATSRVELHRYVGLGFERDYLAIKTRAGWMLSPPLEILTDSSHTSRHDVGTVVAVDLERTKVGGRDAWYVKIRADYVEWCCESKHDHIDRKFTFYYTLACTDAQCIVPDFAHEPPVVKDLTWDAT